MAWFLSRAPDHPGTSRKSRHCSCSQFLSPMVRVFDCHYNFLRTASSTTHLRRKSLVSQGTPAECHLPMRRRLVISPSGSHRRHGMNSEARINPCRGDTRTRLCPIPCRFDTVLFSLGIHSVALAVSSPAAPCLCNPSARACPCSSGDQSLDDGVSPHVASRTI